MINKYLCNNAILLAKIVMIENERHSNNISFPKNEIFFEFWWLILLQLSVNGC